MNLPELPSELLALALKEFLDCESKPDAYGIDMDNWIVKDEGQRCTVCLAGALLRGDPETQFNDLPLAISRKLCAVNLFRLGLLKTGVATMLPRLPAMFSVANMNIPEYGEEGWLQGIKDAIDYLKSQGL